MAKLLDAQEVMVSMHLIDKSVGFYGTSAIVGNSIPIGVGLSFSLIKSKKKIYQLFI